MNRKTLFNHIRQSVMLALIGALLGSIWLLAEAQKQTPPNPVSVQALDKTEVDRIIAKFTAHESELLKDFNRYGYKRDLDIQSINNGKVVGEYHRISKFQVDEAGVPFELILSLPMPTGNIQLTLDDLENLSGSYQFPLQSANVSQYKFAYVGKEQITNWDLHVFDVKPVSLSAKYRLFHGRIWVDVASLRIVKMLGKFEQKGLQKFPVLETFRTAIDKDFLFPAIVSGDDVLEFGNGQSIHLRINVTFTDYLKLR